RFLTAPLSAAAAAFPLFSEPSRVLLVWPTQIQYLLPMVLAGLAVHEAVSGRLGTAAVASLGAVLGHELGMLAVAGVFALWAIGHAIAHSHGTQFLADSPSAGAKVETLGYLETFWRGLVSQ